MTFTRSYERTWGKKDYVDDQGKRKAREIKETLSDMSHLEQ